MLFMWIINLITKYVFFMLVYTILGFYFYKPFEVYGQNFGITDVRRDKAFKKEFGKRFDLMQTNSFKEFEYKPKKSKYF